MPPSKRPGDLIAQLQKLGLTASESKAYLAVVKSGGVTAVQIAREAQLQRTEIYLLMSRLVSKGLVEETIDKPKRYRASDPQIAIVNLAHQTVIQLANITTAAEDLAAKLNSLRTTTALQKRPEVRVISGWGNIDVDFFEQLESAQRVVWMIAGRQLIMRTKGSFVAHLLKTVTSKGLVAKLITELDERTFKRFKRQVHLVQIRHCENVPVHLYGFDDRVVCIGLTPSRAEDHDRASEIHVTHPECVSAMRNLFESLWEQSVPFNAWLAAKEEARDSHAGRSVIWGRERLYTLVADWHLRAREEILDHLPTENGPVRVVDQFGKELLNTRNRGAGMRSICNITPKNLAAVREMCKFAEVRHTDSSFGVGFTVLDESDAVIHYVQMDTPHIRCPTDISIYMRDRDGIRRLKETFELLWKNSIPAEIKIRELSKDQREPA